MEEELTNVKLCSGTLRNSGRNKGLMPPMGPLPAPPPRCHPYCPGHAVQWQLLPQRCSGHCSFVATGCPEVLPIRQEMFIPGISVSLKNTQGWSMSCHAGVWCWVLEGKMMGGPCLHMTKPVSLLCSAWA